MTWKDRSKETQSVYRCLGVVLLILAIGLYLIAGMDAQERKERYAAETVRQLAQIDWNTAHKRAVKEYGR